MKNPVIGGEAIEKKEIEPYLTKSDSGTPTLNYDKLKKDFPIFSQRPSGSYTTPDMPTTAYLKRLGEDAPISGIDMTEEMALGQGAAERWAYFLPRVAAKALSSAASLPGYMSGFDQWASTGFNPEEYGNAFNNGWISAIETLEEDIKKLVPVYTPRSVSEGGLWKNLGSSAFWANEGADGVGFLIGMLAPGALVKGLKAGEAVQGFWKTLKPGFQLSQKLAGRIDDWTAVALNTTFEAASEGNETYRAAMAQYNDPELAGKAAANTFTSNIAILVGPNILQQKWLFNGFNRGKSKAAESVLNRSFDKSGALLETITPLTKLDKALKVGKTLSTGVLSEGFFEEGLQNIVSTMAKEGTSALDNLDEVAGEYIETILGSDKESTDFWKSVVLGGLLGGGMSTVGAIRNQKSEEELSNEYHKLLKANYINRYTTLKDFAVIKDGKPVIDENGELVIDKEKLSKATKDQLNEMQMTRFMDLLKTAGQEESFEYYKNILDSRYIYPFLQVEGGIDLFKKHAEYLSNKEAAQDAEATGIDSGLAENIKNNLITKAENLKKIYDDIVDSNSITLKNDIKRNSSDTDVFDEFVKEVQDAKISTKHAMEFSLDRVRLIRDKLSKGKAKVSSSETKLNDNLISSLKASLEESKKVNNLDQQDILTTEQHISEIEHYLSDYTAKNARLKELYSKNVNQRAYDKKLEDKAKAEALSNQQTSSSKNTKDTSGLSKELSKIYSDNIIHEDLSLTRKPDLTLTLDDDLRKQKMATHRGIISLPLAEGELFAKVGVPRSDKSLSLQLFDKVGDKYVPTKNRAYLFEDGTLQIAGEKKSVQLSAITTVKTADSVRNDSQIEAISKQYSDSIDIINKIISDQRDRSSALHERIAKISSNIRTVEDKYRDTLSAEEIELRKVRVGSKIEEIKTKRKRSAEKIIKKVIPIYKTVAEARKEIDLIEIELRQIEESIILEEGRVVTLQQGLVKAQNLSTTVLNSLNNSYFRLLEEIAKSRATVKNVRNDLSGLRTTLRKLLFRLKSIQADLIDAFKIPIDRDALTTSKNNFEIISGDKKYQYTRSNGKHMIKGPDSDTFQIITKEQYDNAYDSYYTQLEEIGLDEQGDIILKYLEEHELFPDDVSTNVLTFLYKTDSLSDMLSDRQSILEKISLISDMIVEEEEKFKQYNSKIKELTTDIKELKKFRDTFLKEYKAVIGSFFSVDDWLENKRYDDSLDKESVVEGKFGTLFKDGDKIIRLFEESTLKVFDGSIKSFLFPGTDQAEAVNSDQTAYWFAFVNNHAYKEGYSIIAVSQKAAKDLSFGDKLNFIDAEDIKYVAVKKDTYDPVMMDDAGNISDTGTHMAVTSMTLPKYEYTKLIDGQTKSRFSYSKFGERYKTEHPEASAEDIDGALKIEKDKILNEYIALRNRIKNSNTPQEFNIDYVTAGVKVVTKDMEEIDALEAFAIDNIAENASFVIESVKPKSTGEPTEEKTKHKASNSIFNLTNGYLYIRYKNRFELIKPKTVNETEDVDNILNLFKFVAEHLHEMKDGKLTQEAELASHVRTYLTKVLYHNAVPSTGFRSDYRLFFRKDSKGQYTGLAFGENFVSMKDLISGKLDKDLKVFLSNKYWNFNKKLIEDRGKKFVEFKARLDNKGVIKVVEKNHKSYLHFLFPNNKPTQKGVTLSSKGMVLIKPAPKDKNNHIALAKDPQYINQSLQLSLPEEKKNDIQSPVQKTATAEVELAENQSLLEIVYKDSSGKVIKKYMILDKSVNKLGFISDEALSGILSPLKLKKDSIVDSAFWSTSLRAILRAEDGTSKINSDTVIGGYTFKFYSGKFSLIDETIVKPAENTSPTTQVKITNKWEDLEKTEQGKNIKSVWIENAKQVLGNEAKAEDIEETAKYNYNKKYADTSTSSKTELERRVTIYENYEIENITLAKRWLQTKFPNIPIEIINGIINNNAWGAVLSSGRVLLSDIAEVGTGYHEGWHVYSQFFLTEEERNNLYKETRDRLNNNDLSDKEVEEILAEDFRDFMLMGNSYKFNKITEVKKENIFRKILNFIKELFGITTDDLDTSLVEKAFNNLRDNSFTEIVSRPKDSFFKVANLSPAASQAFIEDINTKFLKYLVDTVADGEDIIMNLDQSVNQIYSTLKAIYQTNAITEPMSYASTIVKNWDELIKKHSVFLTQYKVDIRDQVEEDDQLGRNKNDFLEAHSKNIKDEVPSPIRLLIGSLADTRTENGEIIINTKEGFGTEVRVKFNKLMTAINNIGAGSSDITNFYQNLTKLIPQYPAMRRLLRILGINIENGIAQTNTNISKTQFDLRNQMYHSFANNKTTPIIGIISDIGINYVYPIDENEIKVLKIDWINNALELARTGKSKYLDSDNNIKKESLLEDLTIALKEKTTDKLKSVLSQLGIFVEPKKDLSKDNVYVKYSVRLRDELMRSDLGNIVINDLYDRDRIENQKEMDAILRDSMKGYINDSDLTHQTIDGNLAYGVSRGSHIHEVSDRINAYIESDDDIPLNLKYIVPLSENGVGNLFTINSEFYKYIQEARNNRRLGKSYNLVKIVKLEGLKDKKDNGDDLKKETHFDYLMMTVDSILNNTIPVLRAGDRGPEYGISFLPNENTITRNDFIVKLRGYLYDEILTTVALLKDPNNFGGKYKHYNEHAKKLRVFSFIENKIGSVQDFIETKDGSTLENIKNLTREYIDKHSSAIDAELNVYINEMMYNNLQELKEWKLIKSAGKDVYKIPGLSFETLKNLGIHIPTNKLINISDLTEIMMRYAYNYFVGSQEQIKIYLGDLAFFKNGKDFHKRITSHTSTRTKLANDQFTIDFANEHYPQVFNKHKREINSIVWDKITLKSNVYKDRKTGKSREMDVADGLSWSTLEFARTIKIRQGLWTDKAEATYMYEYQKLMLKLLEIGNEDLIELLKVTREDIQNMFHSGVFSNHTNGTIPTAPMFNGKKITTKDMATIGAIKTLGVGAEQSTNNLFAPIIKKHSVAPIIPSILPRASLKIYLSAIANDIDLFNDASVEKETYVSSGKYGEITENSVTNIILFDDLGVQSDMNTEDKERITKSTQMNRVLFVQTHDKGQLLKEFENTKIPQLIEEHKNIISTLTKLQMNKLKLDLGISLDDNNNFYLEDIDKFREQLLSMVESRVMPDNVADGIIQVLDSKSKSIDILITKKQIESILLALPKNRALSLKVSGEMYAQESSWMYSEDGSPVLNFGYDKGNPMEVMIPIPEKWIDYVDNLKYEKLEGIDALNKMIEDGKIDERILTITANRIPTAAPNTLEAIRIKRFLPYHAGPRIILPYDIVIKTSSDFDIDKLFTYLNNVKVTKKGLSYIEYLDDSNSTVKERYEAYYDPELIKEDELLEQVSGLFKSSPIGQRQTMTFEEFENLPVIEQNTQRAIENKFNVMSFEALMMPERREVLLKPHESTDLKDIADSIKKSSEKTELDNKESSVESNYKYLVEHWYNARKYREFQASKSLVSFVASGSSVNNKAQEHPIRIVNPILDLFFEQQEKKIGQSYINGQSMDSNDFPVYDNYGQFLVAAVDAVKDPYIFQLLFSNEVYSIYSFLNKTGIERGVGLKTLAKFLTAPIIKEYLRERIITQSLGYNNSPYSKVDLKNRYNERALIIEELVKKHSSGKKSSKDLLYPSFETYLYASSKNMEDKAISEYTEKKNLSKYKYLSELDMADPKNAVQILDNFLIYERVAREEIGIQTNMRFDASGSFPKSLSSLDNRLDRYTNLQSKTFNIGDIRSYNDNSYLSAFLDIYYESNRLYQWTSYIFSNEERKALFSGMVNNILTNPKNSTFSIRRDKKGWEKVFSKIENDFYQYIYMTMKYNKDPELQRTVYRKLLLGKDSIPKRFNSLKKKGMLDSTIVKVLRPIINEYSNSIGKIRENDYITTFTKKHDLSEENDLTNAIESMMVSPTEEIRKLGNGLYELGLIQSGLTGSPISYARYLPSSRYVKEMDNYIIDFFKQPDAKELINGFVNQFGKVNSTDTLFVPKHHKLANRIPGNKIEISKQVENPDGTIKMFLSRNVGARYVNVRLEAPYSVYKEKSRFNRKVPTEYVLFEFVEMTDPEPNLKLPMAIYRRVDKLGDGFRFLEYYTDKVSSSTFLSNKMPFADTPKSILKDNSYDFTEDKLSKVNTEDDINAQFNEARENYQLLNADITEENIIDLDNKMKDFLSRIGVNFEETAVLKNKFGDNTALAIADLTNMTVKVLEGKMNLETLPEEAAHFYIHLLDKTTGLYKSMMVNIVNHPIYSEVKDKYKGLYTTEEEFRHEAIGQVIAKEIVKQYSAEDRLIKQANTWWNILWNWVKNLFNKRISDPYSKVAYDILNNKISELLLSKSEGSDMYQLNNSDYYKTFDPEDTGADVGRPYELDNIDELSKGVDNLDMSNLIANFDMLFPDQNWRTFEEKKALIEATLYGHTEIVCEF